MLYETKIGKDFRENTSTLSPTVRSTSVVRTVHLLFE